MRDQTERGNQKGEGKATLVISMRSKERKREKPISNPGRRRGSGSGRNSRWSPGKKAQEKNTAARLFTTPKNTKKGGSAGPKGGEGEKEKKPKKKKKKKKKKKQVTPKERKGEGPSSIYHGRGEMLRRLDLIEEAKKEQT